jgi:hypothetical protein
MAHTLSNAGFTAEDAPLRGRIDLVYKIIFPYNAVFEGFERQQPVGSDRLAVQIPIGYQNKFP